MVRVYRKIKDCDRASAAFWFILLLACALRLIRLNITPGNGGVNQDEAFAAWNAWSILHTGMDSSGYRFPVYLEAWGSGMNALYTYVTIPFVAALGLTVTAMRLPQAILGCITVAVFYCFCRELTGSRRTALLGMAFLAISPWHIMMSRWGLESNFLPGMLLTGLTLWISSGKHRWKIVPAALFLGLSLYCYAADWIVMPFLVLGSAVILYRSGQMKRDGWTCAAIAVLALLAIPLLLFVAVNLGIIPEICTPFLSIPRINTFRSGDFSIRMIPRQIYEMMSVLIRQEDGWVHNTIPEFGTYYKASALFITAGIGIYVWRLAHRNEPGDGLNAGEKILLLWFALSLLLGCITTVNINRLNIIHLPMIYFWTVGCERVVRMLRDRAGLREADACIGVLYLVLFMSFESYYMTHYDDECRKSFGAGFDDALAYAQQNGDGKIYFTDYAYPVVLFWSGIDGKTFLDTVEYADPGAALLTPVHFGNFVNGFPADEPRAGDAYLCPYDFDEGRQYMVDHGMTITDFDTVIVGTKE